MIIDNVNQIDSESFLLLLVYDTDSRAWLLHFNHCAAIRENYFTVFYVLIQVVILAKYHAHILLNLRPRGIAGRVWGLSGASETPVASGLPTPENCGYIKCVFSFLEALFGPAIIFAWPLNSMVNSFPHFIHKSFGPGFSLLDNFLRYGDSHILPTPLVCTGNAPASFFGGV